MSQSKEKKLNFCVEGALQIKCTIIPGKRSQSFKQTERTGYL